MILALIAAGGIWGQGVWTQVADFEGGNRSGATGFSIGIKGYVFGGSSGSQFHRDLWEYDAMSDDWTQKASLPADRRRNAVSFTIDGEAYVGTGYCGGTLYCADFWKWDQVTNTWSQIASYPGEGGIGLTGCIAFSIEGKGYVGLGSGWLSGPLYSEEFWEYDTGMNAWTRLPDFPGGQRTNAVGFAMANKGYVGTGVGSSYQKDFWQYDPVDSSWKQLTNSPGQERGASVGFAIGNKAYLGTGAVTGPVTVYPDLWQCDSTVDSWAQVSDYPGGSGSGVGGGACFVIGSEAYMGIGGDETTYFKDFWRFSPDSVSGIIEADLSEALSLWPNPASSQVWLRRSDPSPATLTVLAPEGKVIIRESLNSELIALDLASLPSGIYIVRVACGEEVRQVLLIRLSE